jgi:hypothetical protein
LVLFQKWYLEVFSEEVQESIFTFVVCVPVCCSCLLFPFAVTVCCSRLLFLFAVQCMVMIPFINRTVDIILSDRLEACDVNVHEVIDEFQGQCDNFHDLFEAFVLIVPGRYRVTCKSSRKLAIVEALDFTVPGLPVAFQSVSVYKWVNLTCLSYGVPDEEISKVLSHYGQIKQVKQEQYSHVYTGVRNI